MRVIVTGGGTGGHIYPALAIADTLRSRDKDGQILYIGTAGGLESRLVPERGYRFRAVRVKGFRRSLSIDTVKSMMELFKGLVDAGRIIREFKPDVVVGTGGYVAGPVLMVAHLRGIPTVIHEQNVLPGATNRILGRLADAVAVGFEEAVKYFGKKDRVFVTGNPIRKEITTGSKAEALKEFGFVPGQPVVLSFGGSKGSVKLNRAVAEVIARLSAEGGFQLLHTTGEDHYSAFLEDLEKRGVEVGASKSIKVLPYLHRMHQGLAAADLVITSAGAITLAEITAVGVPALLVPKSYVAGNHQEYNARALEARGAAVVLTEKELDGAVLYDIVSKLVGSRQRLQSMKKASRMLGKIDAAKKICDIIVKTVNR
ncbi:MAG TPA: undecaprenyldiphospho-muramoylpentapeptide beta-N-acetylglucosaminyltransferase [Clostridia bacterium]|nr:undecaprenyldiphospho-muramoylpentapeptide beta-N-acetylglucosaminyltransferase [Clostridia bacterium]